jgi:Fic-DOC domain mobile mystery protein B
MNFILDPKFSDGNTPIRSEEAEQLIPRISTMGELNEYEALNIVQAREWAFNSRTMKSTNPLQEAYLRTLHSKMFDKVWKWAGTYRKNELNIGCDPCEIVQRIPQLLGNTQYWLDQKTFPIDECLIRFHYQLVSKIHPFANGNGRHARMIADVISVKYGRSEFSWGADQNPVAEGNARTLYLAALRALDENENDVKRLVEFARS